MASSWYNSCDLQPGRRIENPTCRSVPVLLGCVVDVCVDTHEFYAHKHTSPPLALLVDCKLRLAALANILRGLMVLLISRRPLAVLLFGATHVSPKAGRKTTTPRCSGVVPWTHQAGVTSGVISLDKGPTLFSGIVSIDNEICTPQVITQRDLSAVLRFSCVILLEIWFRSAPVLCRVRERTNTSVPLVDSRQLSKMEQVFGFEAAFGPSS